MNKSTENFAISEVKSETNYQSEIRKDYTKPELTHYGGISSLVLGVVVATVDGAPNPPFDAAS